MPKRETKKIKPSQEVIKEGPFLVAIHLKGIYMSNYTNSPCAACKFLRRKCTSDCVFAPYFPPEEPTKFANVHRIFGASNVSKILHEVAPHQREDAVNSLAYEAEARLKDPVYGCVGAISVLQRQVLRLQRELEETNADLMRYAGCLGGETTSAYGGRRG